jgi:murein DD-endopeptidase MepM/ murein hydrolase activator NlpD
MLIFCIVALVFGGLFAYGSYCDWFEADAPAIGIQPVTQIGRSGAISAWLHDPGSGLRSGRISIAQNHKLIVLWEQNWSGQDQPVLDRQQSQINVNSHELGLTPGPAALIIESRDNSWRNFRRGTLSSQEIAVQVVLTPPRVTLLSRNININRSGAAVVVYSVNEAVSSSGVEAGTDFYPGYAAWPDNPGLRVCFFSFQDNYDQKTPLRLLAADAAGQRVTANLPLNLRWRKFKTDVINISDAFLQMVAERFAGAGDIPPGASNLEIFQWVNQNLRQRSNQALTQITSYSEARQLWRGAFLRPTGKLMSDFVEQRVYNYKGSQVSSSTHYGLDIADVAAAPVRAAAAGRVVFTGELGIYGRVIVIDHGLNLFTLYAHLSEFNIENGAAAAMGQVIARSGSTGFSFGDHLHFTCMIGDKFVSPYEWWDSHWIDDNVERAYKEAGVNAPY